jgi:trimeric autotransporter adhesin
MSSGQAKTKPLLLLPLLALLAASQSDASEYHGQVLFGGLPVPGATVTVTRGDKRLSTITDEEGNFLFSDLPEGPSIIEVDMLCFAPVKRHVMIMPNARHLTIELSVLPLDKINASASAPPVTNPQPPQKLDAPTQADTVAQFRNRDRGAPDLSADGFLINGSHNNGAASPFAQSPVFGNNRKSGKGLYNGSIGVIGDSSIWDARSFSLTGQNTPKPSYNRFTAVGTLGGPLKIPHLLQNGPNLFVGYQWTRDRDAATESGLFPTAAQRNGNLGNGLQIPPSRISPQALALLNLYPLPNFAGSRGYNYQIPVVSASHQDAMQVRLSQSLNRKDQIFGGIAFQKTRADSSNLLGFLDTTDSVGVAANANWSHRFGQGKFNYFGIQFSRLATRLRSYFED